MLANDEDDLSYSLCGPNQILAFPPLNHNGNRLTKRDTQQTENKELRDDQERKITCDYCTIKPRVRDGTLVSRDLAHDNREKEPEQGTDRRRQHTYIHPREIVILEISAMSMLPSIKGLGLPEAREKDHGLLSDHVSRKGTYSEIDVRFARAEMMSSGMVLKKHTPAMMNQPVSRVLARAASPLVTLLQI